jgi:protein tyrosine phosphatase (PTP) superfamily phosphohydrolase (DUF442 family)
MSPAQRSANTATAANALPAALASATEALNAYGATDARTLRAWELVETHGATIHRQARLLAGKAKGG